MIEQQINIDNLNLEAFTRAKAIKLVRHSTDKAVCEKFLGHKNKHVKKIAALRTAWLENPPVQAEPTPQEESEFDRLVAHFTTLGKPNPVASANASILAKKSNAARKARKEAEASQ